MNNFNQFNNMNMGKGPNPQMMLMGGKTLGSIKFTVAVLVGLLPLMLACMFIGASGSYEGTFHQWGPTGETSTVLVYIDYGWMWLIGIGLYIGSMVTAVMLSRYVKSINVDVIPLVSAGALGMLNLFVIPHSNQAFLILSLPSFAIIGYIMGGIVMVVTALTNMQRNMQKMQNDPNVKKMMEDFEEQMKKNNPQMYNQMMQGRQNTPGAPKPSDKKKEYEDNPYVDIPEEDEE